MSNLSPHFFIYIEVTMQATLGRTLYLKRILSLLLLAGICSLPSQV